MATVPWTWDSGPLSEALQKFRMFGDGISGGLNEPRTEAGGIVPPLQVIDELPHRILLLRCQRPDNVPPRSPQNVYSSVPGAGSTGPSTGATTPSAGTVVSTGTSTFTWR